jgi:hypothetical protein
VAVLIASGYRICGIRVLGTDDGVAMRGSLPPAGREIVRRTPPGFLSNVPAFSGSPPVGMSAADD